MPVEKDSDFGRQNGENRTMTEAIDAGARGERGIDKIDARILRVLQADGRISNLTLAESVHLQGKSSHVAMLSRLLPAALIQPLQCGLVLQPGHHRQVLVPGPVYHQELLRLGCGRK